MEEQQYKSKGPLITGLFLISAGILLFAYKMGAPIPGWIFSWPVALIALGFLISARHSFKNPAGLILILVGSLNLVDRLDPGLNFRNFILPVIFIVLGLFFILGPRHSWRQRRWKRTSIAEGDSVFTSDENNSDNTDYINSVSVFGGVKKNILSKNFKGGEITCFMGGAEFNLSQADVQKQVVLEVTQVFGGTKLIVPAHWHIKTEVITVFGGIEDKRPLQGGNIDYNKVVILIGTTVFGGIDIRSY